MKNDIHIDLIAGYLQNSLSAREHTKFRRLVEKGEIDSDELLEMKQLYDKMNMVEIPDPGNKMQDRFYAMLRQEKAKQAGKHTDTFRSWIQLFRQHFIQRSIVYGAAFSIFVAGLFIGDFYTPFSDRDGKLDQLSSEVYQMRELMMIRLLEDDSASERLRAVNISTEIPSSVSAERVADALLQTLNSDPNINVRIAAVDALVRHASNPGIRQKMVRAISNQDSPAVQIALADAMVALQEENAVAEFRKLLDQNDMDNNVRTKLENTIVALL